MDKWLIDLLTGKRYLNCTDTSYLENNGVVAQIVFGTTESKEEITFN